MTLDREEVINQLTPYAWQLVEQHDPRIADGRFTAAYAESKHYMALTTLVDIALLPVTKEER